MVSMGPPVGTHGKERLARIESGRHNPVLEQAILDGDVIGRVVRLDGKAECDRCHAVQSNTRMVTVYGWTAVFCNGCYAAVVL